MKSTDIKTLVRSLKKAGSTQTPAQTSRGGVVHTVVATGIALVAALLIAPRFGHGQAVVYPVSPQSSLVADATNASDMRSHVRSLPPNPNPYPSEATVGP